ncbi:sensor histidine kinase [Marinilactibacillus psychrotolerans]|uniref:histidine kinase n=1 Tax=Marinilactibacillus psychrotolerans TaxID=191770 RepID=A0A5R9C829_9LACT|nr:histidine kinase [Marinilactibacillus psychrotolerans]TLQ09412.1 sensor histidine kinase [Marinilactibacillus psychrotolerans]
MKTFWLNFWLLFFSWMFALINKGIDTKAILLSALFFSIYFLMPLFENKIKKGLFILSLLLMLSIFYSNNLNLFTWFMYTIFLIEFNGLFKPKLLYLTVIVVYALSLFPFLLNAEITQVLFIVFMVFLTILLINQLRKYELRNKELKKKYIKVYDEHRFMKRQIINNEEVIRQEERNQVAREIHDSVGHRLTALLMQLEVARLKANDKHTEMQYDNLKQLAQSSLQDTRKAVRALKTQEHSGLQAIILLIRKLEAESHLRLALRFQPGVLHLNFTNQQSVVLYRSIQEALTNMMRHSESRTADIKFEIIAQKDFRVEISHPVTQKIRIIEGFGLTSMRERLVTIGGRLNFSQTEDQLSLIFQFPLEVKK